MLSVFSNALVMARTWKENRIADANAAFPAHADDEHAYDRNARANVHGDGSFVFAEKYGAQYGHDDDVGCREKRRVGGSRVLLTHDVEKKARKQQHAADQAHQNVFFSDFDFPVENRGNQNRAHSESEQTNQAGGRVGLLRPGYEHEAHTPEHSDGNDKYCVKNFCI